MYWDNGNSKYWEKDFWGDEGMVWLFFVVCEGVLCLLLFVWKDELDGWGGCVWEIGY